MTYRLQVSYRLLYTFVLLFGGAIICCFVLTSLTNEVRVLLGSFVIANFVYVVRRYVLYRHRKSIILFYGQNNQWQIQTKNGAVYTAELNADSIITRYLIGLNFQLQSQKKIYSVWILPDSLGMQEFWYLRRQIMSLFSSHTQ